MDPMTIIVAVVAAAAFIMLGINVYVSLRHRRSGPDENTIVLHQRLDSMHQLLNDQLRQGRETTDRATLSVQQKMDSLGQLLDQQIKHHQTSTERATLAVHQQVQSFTQGMTQLSETVRQVQESVKGVASFQDIFRSPKLRGIWGELSLESALGQYFPKDRYIIQHYFKSGEAVDAALRLPNELLLPIDSKFNWENFEKMTGAETEINKDLYRKQFLSDVKKKIDEIAAKYILPSEGTTDLALMYVPAETVYYEIINNIKEADIPHYARSKKVYLVSPNTFALSVSAISHWLRDVQITKQTQDIIKRLARISTDGEKLGDDFRRLGKHLSDTQSAYKTADDRLVLMVDRVKNVIEIGEKEEKRLEPPKV